MEAESRTGVARGGGKGEWEVLLNGCGLSVLHSDKVREVDGADGRTTK